MPRLRAAVAAALGLAGAEGARVIVAGASISAVPPPPLLNRRRLRGNLAASTVARSLAVPAPSVITLDVAVVTSGLNASSSALLAGLQRPDMTPAAWDAAVAATLAAAFTSSQSSGAMLRPWAAFVSCASAWEESRPLPPFLDDFTGGKREWR